MSIDNLSTVLQNAPFCIAKLPLLERKTGSFRMQKWQFWNAKVAVLERKSGSFRNHSDFFAENRLFFLILIEIDVTLYMFSFCKNYGENK